MNTQKIVQSQHLAALKMLREAIVKCPPAVWDAARDKDKFWYKAQHALYWAHKDMRAARTDFVPWKGHRKPDPGAPISKAELLEYLDFIWRQAGGSGPSAARARSGGRHGFRMEKLEQVVAGIRHIQQHTGELYERLGSREHIRLHWTEHVPRKNA